MATPTDSVQCFGRKKTAVAVTHCKRGRRLIRSTAFQSSLSSPRSSASRRSSLSSSSVITAFPEWTCASVSRAVVTHPRSTFAD
ncbi:hypothetical protein CASFOL_021025 [Castilleja foliolosa]|uniref:Uncharacterized protein n=1 Tax=Castilleja foliolosa TaxID=1961234 RepID=A0ABD3D2H8_9LAMI